MAGRHALIRSVPLNEYKHLSRMERLYLHMMNDMYYTLSPEEDEYLDRLKQVYTIACTTIDAKTIHRKLMQIMPETAHYHRKYIQDSQELFGQFMTINKDFERGMQSERLKQRIAQLEREQPRGWMDTSLKYEEQLMKLLRLNVDDAEDAFDWSKLEIPTTTYSSSVAFLSAGAEDIEIIDEDGDV